MREGREKKEEEEEGGEEEGEVPYVFIGDY